ncbi:MAG TPA: transposase [Phascolarctobacterium succinatutens]|uniref:RNA-guided endonuclease TnpB family protein n=1 Tax=Phascolarctobacterium succinatutens TaxID=626940 RepID=UPI000ED72A28|nr:transposase [Phascolarctobacterium succinatutens]
MIVNKAYRYRLYPTIEQKIMFAKTFGCARFIYNKMLGDRLDYYKETGKRLNNTPAQYKKEFPWLKEVDSLALANAQINLNKAYNNFWSNRKHFGKPCFKSKKTGHASYSTNNQHGSVRIEGNKVKLPKIGWVKLCLHRPLMENSTIKTVTISKTPSGKYYISILVKYENQILPIIPKDFLGLDFAMHGLYVASDEDNADYPNFLRAAEKRLGKAQRKLSKRQKGSRNRDKQRLRVAVLHEKIANQRRDFLHKKARYLADRYDAIGIEDISVKVMAKRKKGGKFSFGKSISDNGWSMFTSMLEYKLAWQGKQLIKIDKWYPSSQLCHVCGYQNNDTKDLSVREWDCPKCGSHHNRDKNAAINIREEARRISA